MKIVRKVDHFALNCVVQVLLTVAITPPRVVGFAVTNCSVVARLSSL